MKLLMCNCYHCKAGRKRSGGWKKIIRGKQKSARSQVRRLLKSGNYYHLPTKIYIGYTD